MENSDIICTIFSRKKVTMDDTAMYEAIHLTSAIGLVICAVLVLFFNGRMILRHCKLSTEKKYEPNSILLLNEVLAVTVTVVPSLLWCVCLYGLLYWVIFLTFKSKNQPSVFEKKNVKLKSEYFDH